MRTRKKSPPPAASELPSNPPWIVYGTKKREHWVCQLCRRAKRALGDPDPCLGKLPGVANACCGHGVKPGYVCFENGRAFNFDNPQVMQLRGPKAFDAKSCDDYVARGRAIKRTDLAQPGPPRPVPKTYKGLRLHPKWVKAWR
jgi:hypothetical protein